MRPQDWPEAVLLAIVVLGYILALSVVNSLFMCALVFFLSALVFGRMWYRLKNSSKFTLVMVIIGFVVGYLLASTFLGFSNIILLLLIFIAGMGFSYYVHEKRYITSTEC